MNATSSSPASMRLRVLTLNVWNTEGPQSRQTQVRELIEDLAPDLVCLQEVVRTPQTDQLRELLGETGLHAVHDTDLIKGDTMGLAIGSRWAPTQLEAHRLRSDTDLPTLIAAVVPLPIGEDLLFLGAFPSWRLTDEAARCQQALEITEIEERLRTTAPTVLAGDFDASPDNDSIRFYTGRAVLDGRSAHFRDAWTAVGNTTPGYTWTTENDWVKDFAQIGSGAPSAYDGWVQLPHHRRIDYVFLGSPERHPRVPSSVLECRVVGDTNPAPSDHYGVFAELELRRSDDRAIGE